MPSSPAIRPLTVSELPHLVPLARLFYDEGKLPGTLRPEVWLQNLRQMMTSGIAGIFGIWREGELLGTFEEWARSGGAERIVMVHLSNFMPAKLRTLYERRGYRELETHYIKTLARSADENPQSAIQNKNIMAIGTTTAIVGGAALLGGGMAYGASQIQG